MFTLDERERDRVRDRVLELASSDSRVVAAAIVGSLALGGGDEWSDIDLTFGVADGVPVEDVLEDWSRILADEYDAVILFDLVVRGTTYRVFLLPEWLQVDLSFSPASEFRQGSPRFKLVFGSHTVDHPPPPAADNLFGWAVVYARAARVSIERGDLWQAEFMISALRDNTLDLAALRHDLPTGYGRGFDRLPATAFAGVEAALVRSVDRDELLRALAAALDGLLREAAYVGELGAKVEPQLRRLTAQD